MATSFLQQTGVQLVFADHAGDFAPATASDLRQGSPTNVQMAFASIILGSAWQSAKFDFGATRAAKYSIMAALEFASSGLTAGRSCSLYLAPSPDPTAANGNPGGVSGSSAAYTGIGSNTAASLLLLQRIGRPLIVTANATGTIQVIFGGVFSPPERYGSLVFLNDSGATMHSDDVEMHITLTPIEDIAP